MTQDNNSQAKNRRTLHVSIDDDDLLQRSQQRETGIFRDTDAADNEPTEYVPRNAERTVYVAPGGDMKPKQHQGKWLVGWLVAVSGPMKGLSYTLSVGNNHVGRGKSNGIILADDPCISENSQIIVTYVKGKGDFYITPSMLGTQTTMLNDLPLLSPTPLKERDIITLSDYTKLCFVSFCNSNFRWETSPFDTQE